MHYKYVNQPVMNAPQKMRLKIKKRHCCLEQRMVMKKDMINKEFMREKTVK